MVNNNLLFGKGVLISVDDDHDMNRSISHIGFGVYVYIFIK